MLDLRSKTIFPNKSESPMETVKGVNSTFYTGIDDLINHKFDKLVVSHSYIYWISLPSWFEKDQDLKFFKAMSEKNYRGFQGLSNMTLQIQDVTTGVAGNQMPVVTGIERGNTRFTLEHNEYSGSPMRKMYQKWVSYIRDPRAGISTYGKLFGVEYGAANHTGELLYMVVRPDANNNTKGVDILEFAAYFSNVAPTEIPTGMYNYTMGEAELPTVSMEFVGVPEIGPYVDEFARKILKENILNYGETSEDGSYPWVDSYGTDENAISKLNAGRLKDIYNPEQQ